MLKKVLITGSEGFIGSHLVEQMVHAGYSVKAFVLYNSFNTWGWLDSLPNSIMDQVEVVLGDVRDPSVVRDAMKGVDAVLHLAALIAIPFSYIAPDAYVDTNIKGTLNVLQAARDLGTSKIIHTSTSEVYGTARFVPITETHPLQGQSPYSATKIGADQIALSFAASFNTPVSILRPFNTYGPRQSSRAVIPTIITQIANGAEKITLGSLHPTRDFNYVSDTARGFIAALESNKNIGEVVNIGSNFEVSIGDTVKYIAELMHADINIFSEQERMRPENSEVERLWACNKKAKEMLDWSPEYAGVEGFKRGLQKTIDWFCNDVNLKMYKSDRYVV